MYYRVLSSSVTRVHYMPVTFTDATGRDNLKCLQTWPDVPLGANSFLLRGHCFTGISEKLISLGAEAVLESLAISLVLFHFSFNSSDKWK